MVLGGSWGSTLSLAYAQAHWIESPSWYYAEYTATDEENAWLFGKGQPYLP